MSSKNQYRFLYLQQPDKGGTISHLSNEKTKR